MNLDTIFAALSDPTRRAIVTRLAKGDMTVGELARPFDISQPAISRHLRVLEKAQLITNERRGKHRQCHLKLARLDEVTAWIETHRRFWSASFERLETHLKEKKRKNK